jgi:glycosyltransferase involved in cell wall biosynthesis
VAEGPSILVVVPLPPTYRGGTEEYAYRTAAIYARSLPVRILSSSVDPTPDRPPLETGDIPLGRIPAYPLFQRPLVLSPEGLRELRRAVEAAGLVQLHMPFPFVEKKVARWARDAKVPLVLTYHMDADFAGASRMPGAEAVTRLYRWSSAHPALREAPAIVSNSMGYAKESPVLSEHLERVHVIAKGIDFARFGLAGPPPSGRVDPGPELLPGSAPGERRVLFVGRLVPYKGVPLLVEAVERLKPRVPELKLYIAGSGPVRPSLEESVKRRGLEAFVRFLGFVPDARMAELYRSADVVACPSIGRLESTATALEEAAAFGTPTVGSDLPGARESLPDDGRYGLLCTPGDVTAVELALERLLQQPRPPIRSEVRTWDDTAAEYLRLFGELGLKLPGAPAA